MRFSLEETIDGMVSSNYKDRFRAEYWQLKIRRDKLYNTLVKIKSGKNDFSPDSTFNILQEQLEIMNKYLFILDVRAKMEGIDIAAEDEEAF